MEKVPVGRSIAHAYEFLFGRIFQIIGTAWLPALLYATGYYFFLQNAVTWLAPLTHDQAALTRGIAATCGIFLLALVCRAVIGIALTQEALGIRKDIALAHFVVGPREIRLFFAQIRLLLIVIVLDVALVAVVVMGLGAAAKYGAATPPSPLIAGKSLVVIGAVIAAVLLYVAFVLTVLKLSFLLTAVASVERHAKIRRAWQLAGGSGWRIVFVLVGVFLPLGAILFGAAYLLFGAGLAAVMHSSAPGSVARAHAMLQFYADHAMAMAGLVGVMVMAGSALFAGATAAAYRTVTGHEEEEHEDDDALVAPLLVPAHVPSDEPLPAVPDHGHGSHDTHGGHDDHGHKDHGHDESHGGHDEAHGHGGGHDTGHGHDDADDDADDDDDGHGHDDGHGGHNHGHDDHGHGHKSHDDHHGHDDHGHGDHGGHHAKAA
jgi:hypothetical protein